MHKSKKQQVSKKNVTKKLKQNDCNYLVYKSFEKEYKKHLRYGDTKTTKIIKQYLKELNTPYKKDEINPKNNYYDYVKKK